MKRIAQEKQRQKAGQGYAHMETAVEIDQPSWDFAPYPGCL